MIPFTRLSAVLLPLLCSVSLGEPADGEEGTCAAGGGPGCAADDGPKWNPKTISVVLPCAGEGEFAVKTARSIADSMPGGAQGGILAETVVVDDGSNPPLSTYMDKAFMKKYGVKLVRHKTAKGLMGARSAGADISTGDLVVFFDCHVAPQDDWYDKFLKVSSANWRRIVVPMITDLDIDTWTQTSSTANYAKCYMSWNVDFKWIQDRDQHNTMPILSGGLLGMSRRWWNETGGYDSGMKGWGSENIEQSLKTWLCGGEIVNIPDAFVAHMWRKPEDGRTERKYNVVMQDVLTNQARAALGWLDVFNTKLGQYPELRHVGYTAEGGVPDLDVSNLHDIRDRLKCKPFAWFLWRFRHIYEAGGMIPKRTFMLQEQTTKQCLTFLGPAGTHPQGAARAALVKCGASPRTNHPHWQRWHRGNRVAQTGKCCSGLRAWNTDQCLGPLDNRDGMMNTAVCDVTGAATYQGYRLTTESDKKFAPGQLVHRDGFCVVVGKKPKPESNRPPELSLEYCRKKPAEGEEMPDRPWKIVKKEIPIETTLYEKALAERPELFT